MRSLLDDYQDEEHTRLIVTLLSSRLEFFDYRGDVTVK